jgi:putative tryptophan/tyrosine transport system substrate-binding protein
MANNAAIVAKATTTTIPIVFTIGGDPIKMGLVDSLNRPGGNITGVSFLSSDIVTKMLEGLHELMPRAPRIAALVNPTNQNAAVDTKEAEAAARAGAPSLEGKQRARDRRRFHASGGAACRSASHRR